MASHGRSKHDQHSTEKEEVKQAKKHAVYYHPIIAIGEDAGNYAQILQVYTLLFVSNYIHLLDPDNLHLPLVATLTAAPRSYLVLSCLLSIAANFQST